MQIVIDIPEEFEYEFIHDRFADSLKRLCADAHQMAGLYQKETADMLCQAFKNGKLLPKGHGELIDRESTVNKICTLAEHMNEKRSNMGAPYIMTALFIQDNKREFPTLVDADREDESDKRP